MNLERAARRLVANRTVYDDVILHVDVVHRRCTRATEEIRHFKVTDDVSLERLCVFVVTVYAELVLGEIRKAAIRTCDYGKAETHSTSPRNARHEHRAATYISSLGEQPTFEFSVEFCRARSVDLA